MDRRDFIGRAGLTGMAGLGATSLALQSFTIPEKAHSKDKGQEDDTVFNVRDFGAKGDDKTPDSEAIQKALDAAGKVSGTVWFPAGSYLCHDLKVPENICLKADPVWHYRNEPKGAILHLDDENADCVLNITGAFGVHICGLSVQGLPKAQKEIHGIFLNNVDGWSKKEDTFVFDDIKVFEFSGCGVYLKHIWLFIIRHSYFSGNRQDGVRIWGYDGFVTDNQFSGNGENGFGCYNGGAMVMFTANRVEWNHHYGLYLTSGDAWSVTGNSFDRNWGAGLYAFDMNSVSVTGNVFRRCGKDPSKLKEGNHSCQVFLDKCQGITLTGNTCLTGKDDGDGGQYTPLYGFTIRNLECCVISSNALWEGYTKEMIEDLGGHTGLITNDNAGLAVPQYKID